MASYPKWQFVLAQSKDLANIAPLTQASNKSISLQLNRPGSASFTLPMDNDLAASIQSITTAIKAYRTGSTGQKLIWSGYVTTIDEDITQNHMTVNAIGWLDRLNKRMTRQRLQWLTPVDDFTIINGLLFHANLASNNGYTVPIVTGSNPATPTWISYPAQTLPNEGTGGATAYVATTRTKSVEPNTIIGPEITGLTELENGCDIYVDPASRILYVYRKRQANRTSVIFGFNWGPNNVSQLTRQIDPSVLVNYMLVSNRPEITPRFADDLASQAAYGLWEESVQLAGEISVTNDANSILQYYAGAEVALRSQPRQVFSLTSFAYSAGSSVPEPFVEYDIGDKVYLSAKWGQRINVNGLAMRVFGMSFTIDENDNERPGPLQVSPQG